MRLLSFCRADIAAVCMGLSRAAQAQTATIVGTVHVAGDSVLWLRAVDVVLDPTDRQTRTDSLGGFRFVGVPAGEYRVRVRRVGFEPVVMKVVAVADHEVSINVAMISSAQAIATMTIAGKRIDYPVRLAGFVSSVMVAVETPVARRPPHRSVRAVFPHTAPTSDVWRQIARWAKGAGYGHGGANERQQGRSGPT